MLLYVWMRWSYLMKQTASLFALSSSIDKILCGTINSSQMYPTSACSSDFIFPLTLFFWLNVNVSKLEYRHFCKCSHVGSTLNWRVWKTFQQQKCDPRNKGYVFFRQWKSCISQIRLTCFRVKFLDMSNPWVFGFFGLNLLKDLFLWITSKTLEFKQSDCDIYGRKILFNDKICFS